MKKKNYKYSKNKKKTTPSRKIYTNKNKEAKYKITVVTLLLLLLFSSVYISKHRGNLTFIEKGIKDSILKIESYIERPLRYIHNEQKEQKEQKNLYKNYKELEKKVATMETQNTQILELKEQIKQLQESLDINTILSETENIHATILYKNVLENTVTIDKGSKHGIKKGMAVVVKEGMIGIIDKTSNVTSTVKLLSNYRKGQKISVKIQTGNDFVYGLLTDYQKKNRTYIVEEIASNQPIEEGSIILTSGMGSLIPSGIVIGYVKKVTKDHFDLAQLVEAESKVSFHYLDYVTVVKRRE